MTSPGTPTSHQTQYGTKTNSSSFPYTCFPHGLSRSEGPPSTPASSQNLDGPSQPFQLPAHSNLCPAPGSPTSSTAPEYVPLFRPPAPLVNLDTVTLSGHSTASFTIPTRATGGLHKCCSLHQHCGLHLLPPSPCPHLHCQPFCRIRGPGALRPPPKPSLTTTLLPQAASEAAPPRP